MRATARGHYSRPALGRSSASRVHNSLPAKAVVLYTPLRTAKTL
jgi:hypothetical protein